MSGDFFERKCSMECHIIVDGVPLCDWLELSEDTKNDVHDQYVYSSMEDAHKHVAQLEKIWPENNFQVSNGLCPSIHSSYNKRASQ
jgi:hypothetical protein